MTPQKYYHSLNLSSEFCEVYVMALCVWKVQGAAHLSRCLDRDRSKLIGENQTKCPKQTRLSAKCRSHYFCFVNALTNNLFSSGLNITVDQRPGPDDSTSDDDRLRRQSLN